MTGKILVFQMDGQLWEVVAAGGSTLFESNGKLSSFFKHGIKVVFYFFPRQVLLKTDSSWLMKSEASRDKPTIPCFLLFIIHVQQQELGGFTLPSDMYKWTKMR